jgi:hypothetical protein
MAGTAARLLDANPDRVLITIHPHLDNALNVSRALALAPQRFARPAVVPCLSGLDGLPQRLVIHMRNHQHVARSCVSGNTGDKTGRIKFGLKRQPFLGVVNVGL